MTCGTLGCANRPRWLFARLSTRRLTRFCDFCAPELLAKGGYLALVYSKNEK